MTATLTHTSTAREQAIVDLLRLYRDLEGGGPLGSGSGSRRGVKPRGIVNEETSD